MLHCSFRVSARPKEAETYTKAAGGVASLWVGSSTGHFRCRQDDNKGPEHLVLGSGTLLGDTSDVRARDLVEGGHVEGHALGEAALVRRAERSAGAGDALGEALMLASFSWTQQLMCPWYDPQ